MILFVYFKSNTLSIILYKRPLNTYDMSQVLSSFTMVVTMAAILMILQGKIDVKK